MSALTLTLRSDQSSYPGRFEYRDGSTSVYQRQLYRLGNRQFKLLTPILLDIAVDDGLVNVSDPFFAVYGDGETEQEALRDYELSLIGYFEIVEAEANGGHKPTQQLFDWLKKFIDRADS